MDKPPFNQRHDRVCRKLGEGKASEPAETLEEAIAYGHFRAKLLGIRQIVRPARSFPPQRVWYSQSVGR